MKESELQKQVAAYLDLLQNQGRFVWWHTPNSGGNFKPHIAALWKKDGVKAGIPDCLILHKGQIYGIELKRPKTDKQARGTLSKVQKQMFHVLIQNGMPIKTAWSLDEVKTILQNWSMI